MMLRAIASLTYVLCFGLLALGVVARNYRRTIFALEERLRRLEGQGGPEA